jgi:hypothetical protein
MNFNSFDMLKALSFERMGGTAEELKAAEYLVSQCAAIGVPARIENFDIPVAEVAVATLEVTAPVRKTYTVTGYQLSGSTAQGGIERQFKYIGDGLDADLVDVADKIVLTHNRIPLAVYKKLVAAKVAGIILTSGSLYDDFAVTDLNHNILRPSHAECGKIPGVTMRIRDAEDLILSNPEKVKLTLIQKEGTAVSRNVVAEIAGSDRSEEVIIFTAHYDSVKFSSGAYDNATGSTTIFELLAYFNKNKPRRTMKFVWCGAEERGLLGAKAYVEAHKDELKDIKICLNVDMTGVVLGRDIACCTAEKILADYINWMGNEVGFAIKARQGVYSSDSTPFADNGVPAVSFARLSADGGAEIHSRKDVLDFLDAGNYYKTCEFIEAFAARLDNSAVFPVPQTIPDNMKEEIEYYYLKKERPEK